MSKTSSNSGIPVSPRNIGAAGSSVGTYDDLQVSISLGKVPAVNAPIWTDITIAGFTFKALAFDTNDYIDLFIQTTHSTKKNFAIEDHIHWAIANDDNGNEFQFQLTGIGAGIGAAFQSIGTLTSGDKVLASHAGKHNYFDVGTLPAINSTVSSVFVVRLTRIAPADGVDTSEKIYLFFNDCHVLQNTFGSLSETSKT